jgi:hypothetical protein
MNTLTKLTGSTAMAATLALGGSARADVDRIDRSDFQYGECVYAGAGSLLATDFATLTFQSDGNLVLNASVDPNAVALQAGTGHYYVAEANATTHFPTRFAPCRPRGKSRFQPTVFVT